MAGEITRILSDIHFGDRATRVRRLEQLRPLLDGVAHLILNGDTLDTRPGPYPAHTAACREEVIAFFSHAVPNVTYITGNHDPDLSAQHSLDVAGGQLFATHGDIVFDTIVPWSRDARVIGRGIGEKLRTARPGLSLEERLAIWRQVAAAIPQRHQAEPHGLKYSLSYLADTIWPPWRVPRIIRCWQVEPKLVVDVTRRHRPKARIVVTGHLHRPSIWQAPSGVIAINTGAYTPPFGAYAIDLVPGRVMVRRVERKKDAFIPGPAVAEFPLAEP